MRSLAELESLLTDRSSARLAVVAAHDEHVLDALKAFQGRNLLQATLIGDKDRIVEIADRIRLDLSGMELIKETDDQLAARRAVSMAAEGNADFLMKGLIPTADLMRAVLDWEKGLRTSQLISHIEILELPAYGKLVYVTDAGINIAPDLRQKAEIIRNAVDVAHRLGVARPKVAVLTAIEMPNPDIPATIEASALSKMAERGLIRDCLVDGPLSMDVAIDREAARHKGVQGEVAGDADILVPPEINAANILLKSLVFLGKAHSCSILAGTRVPIVVTSRAESSQSKYHSIVLALALSASKGAQKP